MKDILAKAQRAVLEQFAWSRVLLGFDFDGTLAPIVREPGVAKMRDRTPARLAKVAGRYPCAVISGRALADVAGRLDGVPLLDVIGNHGLEPSRDAKAFTRRCNAWAGKLEASLAGVSGVQIEHKGLSVVFRRAGAGG